MAATPNYSGMFLRGYGSQSHTKNNGSTIGNTNTNHASDQIGIVQGDSIRNFTGEFNDVALGGDLYKWSDPRFNHNVIHYDNIINYQHYLSRWNLEGPSNIEAFQNTNAHFATVGFFGGVSINASQALPIADEIRPVNTAIRYLIRCR